MNVRKGMLVFVCMAATGAAALADCPDAPGFCIAAVGPACNTIDVTWPAVGDATSYDVYRAPAATPGSMMFLVNRTSNSHFDSTAVPGTGYVYRVQSRTTPGSGPFGCSGGLGGTSGPSSSATVPLPPGPVSNAGAGDACTGIYGEWQCGSATAGEVFRGTSGTFAAATSIGAATIIAGSFWSFTDATAAVGVTYDYWIVMRNGCKHGPPSGPIMATRLSTLVPATAPTVTASAGTQCGQTTISWPPVPGASDYHVHYIKSDGTSADFYTSALSATFPELTGNTQFNVRGLNACGSGPFSATATGWPWPSGSPSFIPVSPAVVVATGTPASIAATAAAGPAATDLRWHKDGAPVAASSRITGVTTPTLSFAPALLEDVGKYTLKATGPCGVVFSAGTVLAVRADCRADFDENGGVDITDIFRYLNAWFAGCP